jgi:hypothetical protein
MELGDNCGALRVVEARHPVVDLCRVVGPLSAHPEHRKSASVELMSKRVAIGGRRLHGDLHPQTGVAKACQHGEREIVLMWTLPANGRKSATTGDECSNHVHLCNIDSEYYAAVCGASEQCLDFQVTYRNRAVGTFLHGLSWAEGAFRRSELRTLHS